MQSKESDTATNQPGILRQAQVFFDQPAQAPGQQGSGTYEKSNVTEYFSMRDL